MTLITSVRDASVAVAAQTAKPSAFAETPDGFAFVPHTCRFLGQHRAGCRTGGEVMRASPSSPPTVPQAKGRPQSDRGRIALARFRSSAKSE